MYYILQFFTTNIRESVVNLQVGQRWLWRPLLRLTRIPLVPLYGAFPAKLTTHVGAPVSVGCRDGGVGGPAALREAAAEAMRALIRRHQVWTKPRWRKHMGIKHLQAMCNKTYQRNILNIHTTPPTVITVQTPNVSLGRQVVENCRVMYYVVVKDLRRFSRIANILSQLQGQFLSLARCLQPGKGQGGGFLLLLLAPSGGQVAH